MILFQSTLTIKKLDKKVEKEILDGDAKNRSQRKTVEHLNTMKRCA